MHLGYNLGGKVSSYEGLGSIAIPGTNSCFGGTPAQEG